MFPLRVRSSRLSPGLTLGVLCLTLGCGSPASESAPPPTRLAFVVSPDTATWGTTFAQEPTVEARDDAGGLIDSVARPVTLTLIAANGAVLTGTATHAAVAGVAIFAGLAVDRPASGVRLVAAASGLLPDTSPAFNVGGPLPDHLVFTAAPSAASAGISFTTQPVVAVRTSGNLPVPWFSGSVKVALGSGGAGGSLLGASSVPVVSGVATFTKLAIDTAGPGYVLVASAAGLAPDTSAAFTVALGPMVISKSTFVPDSTELLPGDSTRFTLTARDSGGNLLDGLVAALGVSVASGTSAGTFGGFTALGAGEYRAVLHATLPGTPSRWLVSQSGHVGAYSPFLRVIGVASVSAGSAHTCAILTDGRLYCWGASGDGRLGLGSVADTALPLRVGTGTDWSAVAAGWRHTCGLRANGLWCWGGDTWGELGLVGGGPQDVPASVPGTSGASQAATGLGQDSVGGGLEIGHNTCLRRNDNSVWCGGDDRFGQLGRATNGSTANSDSLGQISTAARFTDLAVGGSMVCAIEATASWVWCWGDNSKDQLGKNGDVGASNCADGAGPCQSVPIVATQERAYVSGSLDLGVAYACAISGGAAYCWGTLPFTQGGGRHDSVATAITASQTAQVTVGAGFVCARLTTGEVGCLGSNDAGQLGHGTTSDDPMFVSLSGGRQYADVAAGGRHACAIEQTTLQLWCWGANDSGQLGDGTRTDRDVPVLVKLKL